MEILLAALLPCAVLAVYAMRRLRDEPDARRAAYTLIALTLAWFAPCWLTRSTPVSLDFLTQLPPWNAMRPNGYLDKNFLLNDIPLQMLPWHEAVRRQILAGEPPFLWRHSGGASPLWENLQAAVLYPTTVLGLPFTTFAWALFAAVSKVLVALWGTYLLMRALSIRHRGALFGAIAYGFGAFTITYLLFPHTNVTSLLPLFLLSLIRLCERCDGRSLAAAAVTLFFLIAGGHPESVLHCSFVAIPFAIRLILKLESSKRARAATLIVTAGIIALLLAAPILLPFAAYLPHSQRVGDITTQQGFLSTTPFAFETFIPFAVPNYFGNPRVHNYRHTYNFNEMAAQYVGLVTLVLAFAAIIARWRATLFWVVLLLLFTLLAIEPLPLYEVIKKIPILGITAHSRLRFAIALILAILAGHGFDLLEQGNSARLIRRLAGVAFAGVSLFCCLSYPLFAEYGIRRLIFFTELAGLAGTLILFVSARAWNPALRSLLPFLLFLDLFGVVGLYNPANKRELAYPETPAIRQMRQGSVPYRVTGLDRALFPNVHAFFGLEDMRAHDPLAFGPYVKLLDRAGYDRSLYFGEFHQPPPRALLDYLGVRYLITPPEEKLTAFPVAYAGRDANVYRNPTALPRFFVPRLVAPGGDAFSTGDPLHVVASTASVVAPATIRLLSYSAQGMSLRVTSSGETFIASSEPALPGWRLTRNGSPWPLETINDAFVGWRVPADGGEFTLAYRPRFLQLGCAMAALGIILLVLAVGLIPRWPRWLGPSESI